MSYNKEKITYFKGKVVCPRCDGNGLVYKATLLPINTIVFMCDECEAIWFDSFISKSNFQDFTSYISSLGYTYDQIDITNVNYNWHGN
jgi:hypothetical protein